MPRSCKAVPFRIAFTVNGPGEVAGWLRPLLHRLYDREPDLEAHVFVVPDDYATGREADVAQTWFPRARVHAPKQYVRAALGLQSTSLPKRLDCVHYLGGDLLHAARLHRRFGGRALAYKFSRKRYGRLFEIVFAVDDANERQLLHWGVPGDRIRKVGNLAIDGALLEAEQPLEPVAPHDGILIMPGSRRYEVEHLVPFFFTAALRMHARNPEVAIAFALAPFTDLAEIERAVASGGDPRVYARKGRLTIENGQAYLESAEGGVRFALLRNGLTAAKVARLVLTIPGTKTIELAALSVPVLSCIPLNAPELAAINGPLTYLDRVPLVGVVLKRAAVLAAARRFPLLCQPNIDAGREIIPELKSTLTPGYVARKTLELYGDRHRLAAMAAELGRLYERHAGAAQRMSTAILGSIA
ncbi:MAG: hypothetical protein GIW98_00810 [Candidatus Eremiobacteraeota bacterium]|nr:hypothetical protein [Candidatus Eremiobacteraeota bacterium]